MAYAVKEVYATLQGEGARTGRASVLLRFAGCNLWTGREEHRADAACRFCDTDFVGVDGPGGGKFETAAELAAHTRAVWRAAAGEGGVPYVVCTGGEPLLQLDASLIKALQHVGFEVAVETNGTLDAPPELDWICVSPKGATPLRQRGGDEIKLVYPQAEPEAQPERFEDLAFTYFYLQPLDTGDPTLNAEHEAAVTAYCLQNPQWRLGIQAHKRLGLK
ncbi:MAG: 7-carboxy-7-deazaguanine synthase [Pseudomonadota bacterium]